MHKEAVMDPAQLQNYLYLHIPLSRAMQVSVVSIQPETVILSAPLDPNINHRDTAFGGSVSVLAILSAWSLLYTRLQQYDIQSRLVIQRNTTIYERPIAADFNAQSMLPSADQWSKFMNTLQRRRKARITVESLVYCNGQIAGRFSGDFVAITLVT